MHFVHFPSKWLFFQYKNNIFIDFSLHFYWFSFVFIEFLLDLFNFCKNPISIFDQGRYRILLHKDCFFFVPAGGECIRSFIFFFIRKWHEIISFFIKSNRIWSQPPLAGQGFEILASRFRPARGGRHRLPMYSRSSTYVFISDVIIDVIVIDVSIIIDVRHHHPRHRRPMYSRASARGVSANTL